jgi:hypothetical protein
VNKDFGVSFMGAQEVTALLAAVKDGSLSRETFLRELARRGAIRSDIDPDEEFDRIDEEDAAGRGGEDDALEAFNGRDALNSGTLNNGNRTQ